MSNTLIGINDIAKKVNMVYVGINDVAKKVTRGYVGVNDIAKLFFGGAMPFVAAGTNGDLAYSQDGDTWTKSGTTMKTGEKILIFAIGRYWCHNAFDATDLTLVSSDGKEWIPADGFPAIASRAFAYANNKFVLAESGTSNVHYSTDGKNWTTNSQGTNSPTTWGGLYYLPLHDIWFLRASASSANVWTGKDPAQGFVARNLGTTGTWAEPCESADKILTLITATAKSNAFAYSSDGINFTAGILPEIHAWRPFVYNGNTFVSVAGAGSGETSGTNRAITSTNGIVWTLRTLPSVNNWSLLGYFNNYFITFVSGATPQTISAYSTNGISWTTNQSVLQTFKAGSQIAGNKLFTISTTTTALGVTTNGLNWSTAIMPSATNWKIKGA